MDAPSAKVHYQMIVKFWRVARSLVGPTAEKEQSFCIGFLNNCHDQFDKKDKTNVTQIVYFIGWPKKCPCWSPIFLWWSRCLMFISTTLIIGAVQGRYEETLAALRSIR
jgi:hypothetical protein